MGFQYFNENARIKRVIDLTNSALKNYKYELDLIRRESGVKTCLEDILSHIPKVDTLHHYQTRWSNIDNNKNHARPHWIRIEQNLIERICGTSFAAELEICSLFASICLLHEVAHFIIRYDGMKNSPEKLKIIGGDVGFYFENRVFGGFVKILVVEKLAWNDFTRQKVTRLLSDGNAIAHNVVSYIYNSLQWILFEYDLDFKLTKEESVPRSIDVPIERPAKNIPRFCPFSMIQCSFCKIRKDQLEAKGEILKYCGKCRDIAYCSKNCQINDWKRHQYECFHGFR
jgi:hypothetical protein